MFRQSLTFEKRLMLAALLFSIIGIAGPLWIYQHVKYMSTMSDILEYRQKQLEQSRLLLSMTMMTQSLYENVRSAQNSMEQEKWRIDLNATILESQKIMLQLYQEKQINPSLVEPLNTHYNSWQKAVMQWNQNDLGHYTMLKQSYETLINNTKALGRYLYMIHEESDIDSHKSAKRVRFVSLMSALAFMIGLCLFVYSLWSHFIPGLKALMIAAQEIKKGHLEYRIPPQYTHGYSETSSLSMAFNEMVFALEEQKQKMVAANRLKSDFVSTVSHEIRTPLTAIRGSLGLILGGVTGPINSETRELLQLSEKNTHRLIRLLNDILDISKIESGMFRLKLERSSIHEIISAAIASMQPAAQEKSIRITYTPVEPPPILFVDADRIEQILVNLLSNSIKFSASNSEIQIKYSVYEDQIKIHVVDQGIGITHEDQEHLFEKFHQGRNRPYHNNGGTGLGLAISKAIVEQHGGSIFVSSQPSQGSEFVFCLPWNGKDFAATKQKVAHT